MDKHWVFKYLGRPYIVDKYDCLNLCIDILKEQYGITTVLFSNHGETTLERQKLLTLGLPDYSEELSTPLDGCVTVLSYGGRARHLGIYYTYRGTGNIIHLGSKTNGTITVKANRLDTQCLRLVSYVQYKSII